MPSMNVKVPVTRVIAALEAKLAEFAKLTAEYEKAKAAHEVAVAKYNKAAVAAVKKQEVRSVNVVDNYEWVDGEHKVVRRTVQMTCVVAPEVIGEQPEAPSVPDHHSRWNSEVKDVENAIRILKMTDEQFVNAATFKAISKYL